MILTPILWFLPAYVANASATLSKLFPKTHPIDGGAVLGDGRILGDGKTIEGFLLGITGGTLVGSALYMFFGYPTPIESFLMAFGAMIGDMLGSFIKRRAGIPRGGESPPLDQIDFVFGAFLFVPPPPEWAIVILSITPIVHRVANIIGHKLGVKDEPW